MSVHDTAKDHTWVSISAGIAVAGAPRSDVNGSDAGAVYVFRPQGTHWSEEQQLFPADAAANDFFGHATAVSGATVLASSILDDDKGSASGSSYVFVFDGSTWVQQTKLLATDGTPNDEFGYSVGLEANQAVIGAWRDDHQGPASGSAYVFVRAGTEWSQQSKLLPGDPGDGHKFGTAVAIAGDRVLVGAPAHGGQGLLSGAAYVFVREGTAWTQEAKLVLNGGGALRAAAGRRLPLTCSAKTLAGGRNARSCGPLTARRTTSSDGRSDCPVTRS